IVEETLSGTGRLRRPIRFEPVSVPGLCELPQGQQWHRLRVGGHLGATAVDTNRITGGDNVVPPFSRRQRNEYDGGQRRWCRWSGNIHKLAATAGAAGRDLHLPIERRDNPERIPRTATPPELIVSSDDEIPSGQPRTGAPFGSHR